MCIGAIRMHKIRRVCYASRDPLAGGAELATASPFMREGLTSSVGPQHELEQILNAMLAEYLTRLHASTWADLVEALDPACGPGVRLGTRLARTGELARFAEEGTPAEHIVDWLAARLAATEP
jgi:hypothetical protein